MWRIPAILLVLFIGSSLVNCKPIVPCYFIFGDSLSDAGNNNDLITKAKVNYKPYGVDFPGRIPTGRFTNGRTMPDFISQFLGFDNFISPYSPQMGKDMLRGVNFASGAAGILEETGSQLGDRIWMDRQLKNYEAALSQLKLMVEGSVSDYLGKCLYTVNIGSNDYINNYFMPQNFNSSKLYNADQYADLLITRYKTQLQKIYDSGARKIAVYGLGKIGCTPGEMARFESRGCVKEINEAVDLFNKKLVSLVDYFNDNIRGGQFTFINLAAMQTLNPIPPGFILDASCCTLRDDYQCEPQSRPCFIRALYQYMDGFHPTEVVNKVAAKVSYYTPLPLSLVHPVSIRQLVSSNHAQM
ncbi:hypothetical protein RDABS01_036470 [Bienertia sinuspersici]